MKKRTLMLLLAVALLVTCAVFTVHAETPTLDNTTPVAFNKDTDGCPCDTCKGERYTGVWTELSTVTSYTGVAANTHYIVSSPLDLATHLSSQKYQYYNINANNVVILVESTITGMDGSNALRFGMSSTTKAWLLGGAGGKIIGSGAVNADSTKNGSLMRVGSKGTLYIKNDLTIEATGTATAGKGGLFDIYKGHVYMDDGTLKGINATSETIETYGAVIVRDGGSFTMSGGRIVGGTATLGGAIYTTGAASEVTVGGDAYIEGGTVTSGGAIYVANGAVTVQENAYIKGGTATDGGSVYVAGGELNMSAVTTNYPNGPTITGSTATSRGGCVFISDSGTVNMAGGTISQGTASSGNGATVYVAGTKENDTIKRGLFDMSGGTVDTSGSVSSKSKGIRVQWGELKLSGSAQVISAGGSASGSGVDALYGLVSLDGEATVSTTAGKAVYDILIREYAGTKLTVEGAWTGTATVRFNRIIDDGSYVPGGEIGSTWAASTGDYSGALYLQGVDTLPRIYGVDSKLVFADVALCTADGGIVWQKNNAAAVTAYASETTTDRYIKLYNSKAIDLAGNDVFVDFNGQKNVAVTTGNGTLYGFDSTSSNTNAGQATVSLTGTAETFVTNPVTGESSVTFTESGVTTFHTIKPVISGVSLRPGAAGLYYTGQVLCDSALAPYVSEYGVAVKLDDMPGENFKSTSWYTLEETLEDPSEPFHGMLVQKIIKGADDDNARAQRAIYANAYVTVNVDGQSKTYLSSNSGNAASMDLKSMVRKVNAIYRTLNDTQKAGVDTLYDNYESLMSDPSWRLNNIVGVNGGYIYQTDEDGLKVLMIGNSLSVDAGRMLTYVFAQQGIDNVRISTLYHSGCRLSQHVQYLTGNEKQYTFYDNEYTSAEDFIANGAYKPSASAYYNHTMYDGIVKADWDVIVMQQGVSEAAMVNTYNKDLQTIIDYVLDNDIEPDTKPIFVWNSIWAPPHDMVDYADNGKNPDSSGFGKSYANVVGYASADDIDADAQIKMSGMITDAVKSKIMTNSNFDYFIPSGTAQLNAWSSYLENIDLYRDYIHASDLGRLMNAYVWYSAISGKEITSVDQIADSIPLDLRETASEEIDPKPTTDREVTAQEQLVILESIQNAFKNPWQMTQSQYTTASATN